MTFYNREKIYLAYVDTINPDATIDEKQVVPKVVALKLVGFDKKKKTPTYKPIRNYEYYSVKKVVPLDKNVGGIFGFINDDDIDREIKKTGRPEAKQLLKKAS